MIKQEPLPTPPGHGLHGIDGVDLRTHTLLVRNSHFKLNFIRAGFQVFIALGENQLTNQRFDSAGFAIGLVDDALRHAHVVIIPGLFRNGLPLG